MVKLGELISKAKVKRCGNSDYPVLSMTMHNGIVAQSGRFKKEIASKDTSSYKIVEPGQLVVGFPIDEGVIYVQNFDYAGIMSPAYNVWDINESKVLPAYLELALHSPQSMNYYASKLRGTTARRRSMPPETLCQLPIPLPGKGQQGAIVATLQHVKGQRELALRQLALLDALVKSRFVEMFGDTSNIKDRWDSCSLESCVESLESGKSPSCKNVPRDGLGPGVLKLSALSSGRFLPDENKAMLDGETIIATKEVRRGDILIARKNTPELVGSCVLVREDVTNLMFPDIVFRMHPNGRVDGEYLVALLSGPSYSSKVKGLAHGSNKSMSNIPKSELAKLPVPIPPLALQQEFADFVAQVDKSRFVGTPRAVERSFSTTFASKKQPQKARIDRSASQNDEGGHTCL